MRPGEKLTEELETKDDELSRTRHPKIFIGKIMAYPPEEMRKALDWLSILARHGREPEIRAYMNSFLPEAQIDCEAYLTFSSVARAARVS